MAKRVVVAIGGNAILLPNQRATYANQLYNIKRTTEFIAQIEQMDYEIVVIHGNGPQVGNILFQNHEAKEKIPMLPLEACNAQSQGLIGYMIEQSLKNTMEQEGGISNVATILTQVEVSADDAAFLNPTKFIGMHYTEEEAIRLRAEKQWTMKQDCGKGYRHVLACPEPQRIHGVESIVQLLNANTIVIAGGGGGIPVARDQTGLLHGVEAVIDKDLTGEKLAEQVDADVFMMLTDIENVYLNYGTENPQKLENITTLEAKKYYDQQQFLAGSMEPKMKAAIRFAEQGKKAIICSLEEAAKALAGKAGTHIVN